MRPVQLFDRRGAGEAAGIANRSLGPCTPAFARQYDGSLTYQHREDALANCSQAVSIPVRLESGQRDTEEDPERKSECEPETQIVRGRHHADRDAQSYADACTHSGHLAGFVWSQHCPTPIIDKLLLSDELISNQAGAFQADVRQYNREIGQLLNDSRRFRTPQPAESLSMRSVGVAVFFGW